MNRFLASLSASALLAGAVGAQCFSTATPGTLLVAGDDAIDATHRSLGFAFPMAGSAGTATWTHFRACTNGWLMLTDGVNSTGLPSPFDYSAGGLPGLAGDFPRIAPYWGDLNSTGVGNGVFFDNVSNAGVSCTITFKNLVDFGNANLKSFQIELFATGNIKISYSSGMNVNAGGTKTAGFSCSNGTALPGISNFVPGPTASATGAMRETFTSGLFDMGGRSLTFVPAGAGWSESVTCTTLAASNTSYGTGCYNLSDSFYQSFATAALASPILSNTAITLAPSGGGYLVTSGGSMLAVGSVQAVPTIVAAGDDVEQAVPFTVGSFPGSTGLSVCSNGFVSLATGNSTTFNVSSTLLLNDPQTSFRSAHDMNPSAAGSGQIKYEESATVTMVTWDGVYDFGGSTAADANTIQIQMYPSGTVVIAWGTLSTLGASGIGYVVGYSPGGPSTNPGSIDIAASVPFTTSALNVAAMSLAVTPAPVSTGGGGTVLTYTSSNIPSAGAPGVYLATTVLSLGQDLLGTDMGPGAPGCRQYITSPAVFLAPIMLLGPTDSQTFVVPAGVAYGFQFYAQSIALAIPGSLPGGLNPLGLVTSNGVASFVSFF